jgi:energy-coupling factor transport system substrate-specific component
LAVDIAEQYGLSSRQIEALEQAALLHDIGKIDIVYSEILKKPASLTDEEREIIESHVTKGVELLKSLSSFPSDVILSIKHHHELIDGK